MEVTAYTVSEINNYIKRLIGYDSVLQDISIIGEISNYKPHYSGHMYFTIKDETSKMKCVMFRGNTSVLNFNPKDGDRVIAKGSVGVFERDGQYQFYVTHLFNYGVGELFFRFEQLKAKLEQEGLFDERAKKELPYIPEKIGIVTSSTGAAIRDIISVITRRWNNANIVIYPVAVQGEEAPSQIASAIDYFSEKSKVDVIIVGRGGGSIEELWAFNEEIVARSIHKCKVPIISAVGHETDYTISDFVADVRAATPSAAAELAIPDKSELKARLNSMNNRLLSSAHKLIFTKEKELDSLKNSYIFRQPYRSIDNRVQALDGYNKTLISLINQRLSSNTNSIDNLGKVLGSLNPLSVLERGFIASRDEANKPIMSIKQVNLGQSLSLVFKDGEAKVKVESIKGDL